MGPAQPSVGDVLGRCLGPTHSKAVGAFFSGHDRQRDQHGFHECRRRDCATALCLPRQRSRAAETSGRWFPPLPTAFRPYVTRSVIRRFSFRNEGKRRITVPRHVRRSRQTARVRQARRRLVIDSDQDDAGLPARVRSSTMRPFLEREKVGGGARRHHGTDAPSPMVSARRALPRLMRPASHCCVAEHLVSRQMLHSHLQPRFAPLHVGRP